MQGLLPIIKKNSGCDFHRIINPLNQMGIDTNGIPTKSTTELLQETKIIFFNRTPENPFDKVMEYKKKYGFKIVQDLDDIWQLNINHPMYPTWTKNKIGEEILLWLKNADAVTVTTARLADKVRLINPNTHVIPNALNFGEGQFNDHKSEDDGLTKFIYAGGSSHIWDLRVLNVPFQKVNGLSNAQFVLAGYDPNHAKGWDKIEKVYTLGGKLKNYVRVNSRPLDSYMDVYNNADVSLVPLENNIFTGYKSNIKFLEAGCKYMPVICSNNPPYSDEPDKSKVMYAGNVREWVHWITYCAKNKHFVNEKGAELGEYVREKYDLRKINEYRKQLFEHLIS